MLKKGMLAPQFSTVTHEGKSFSLSSYRGKNVVLYFYPRDSTQGCTKQACSFRDNFASLQKFGVEVFGISADPKESHERFVKEQKLPFILLLDQQKQIAKDYEALRFFGLIPFYKRITYLIDKEGIIREAIHAELDMDAHVMGVKSVLEKLNIK